MKSNVLRWAFGLFFVAAGANHFFNPRFYLAIMPPYLPWHGALVFVSGVAEVLLGAMLCSRRTQRLAAWGLIMLLIAIFPANIHMALNPDRYPGIPSIALWLRLPLQFVMMAMAWSYTRRSAAETAG